MSWITQKATRNTRRYDLVEASKETGQKLSSKYVLVLRHTFDQNGLPKGTFVDLRGAFIREVLSDIFRDVKEVHLSESAASVSLEVKM